MQLLGLLRVFFCLQTSIQADVWRTLGCRCLQFVSPIPLDSWNSAATAWTGVMPKDKLLRQISSNFSGTTRRSSTPQMPEPSSCYMPYFCCVYKPGTFDVAIGRPRVHRPSIGSQDAERNGAPILLWPLLDGLIWRSRITQNGWRRVNYFIKNLLQASRG